MEVWGIFNILLRCMTVKANLALFALKMVRRNMSFKKSYNRAGRPIFALTAKNKAVKYLFTVLTVLGFALSFLPFGAYSAHAQGQVSKKDTFFETLYDVPVMAGLEEIKAEALLFDKPDGKIAFVKAASKTLSVSKITEFYAQTLPQMGWKKTKENQYVRGNEQLQIDVKSQNPFTIVEFTLSPAL